MSLTRKVAYNTIVQIIGKVITTLISLFLVVALTRYLGVAGFGQYTTIFAFTQFFAVLADFGFFWFLVREIAKPDVDTQKITNNVLTFRAIIALIIFLVSFGIGFLIPQYHDIRAGIGIIAAASFWLTLNGTYVAIFQNKLRMDKAAITDALGRLVILALVIYLINRGATLNQLLWTTFWGNLANFLGSFILGRTYLKFRPAFDLSLWKKIFWECLPISVVSILGMIYFKIDTVILSLVKGSIDVGIYGPPYKVLEILLLFPAIFMGNIFPIITNYIYRKDDRLKMVFQKSFDFLIVMAIPLVVGVVFTSDRIIETIAGKEFITAHTVNPIFNIPATSGLALQILIIAVGISFMSHLFGYAVIAVGKQKQLILPNLLLVVFNIVLNLILIPKYSYIGAAVTTVLTEFFVVIMYWKVLRKYLKLEVDLKIVWKALAAGTILGGVLWLLNSYNLWIVVPVGIVIYFAALWLVGGFSKKMILGIIKPRINDENSN